MLKNPGDFFGVGGNNHHCLFSFKDRWYMAYHSRILEQAMGLDGGYRNSHIDEVQVTPGGAIEPITATRTGVSQLGFFDPYGPTRAETMGILAGINVAPYQEKNGPQRMALTVHSGDWIGIYGVDFGLAGASGFSCRVRGPEKDFGAIQIRLDSPEGAIAGYVKIAARQGDDYSEITVDLPEKITGIHDLIFVFYGDTPIFDQWRFIR
jgi:arabinoxylan arabinofuranohydrolase